MRRKAPGRQKGTRARPEKAGQTEEGRRAGQGQGKEEREEDEIEEEGKIGWLRFPTPEAFANNPELPCT